MSEDAESVGEVNQAAISANIENKADAFGLVEWFAHELTNAHQTMTETEYRVDVTVEFREVKTDE